MHSRLADDIQNWWTSNDNAVKDNGISGIARLNKGFDPRVSPDTYYFTVSFDATRPFPRGKLSGQNLQNFPTYPRIPSWVFPGPFNFFANRIAGGINIAHNFVRATPGYPGDVAYVNWFVDFFNNCLGLLGYQIRLPTLGGRIPRADMLPALSIFSVGMSGRIELSEQNDGVVDTSSMRTPENQPVQGIQAFNLAAVPKNKGVYWDLGLTEGIDHADEVGVFTDPDMVSSAIPNDQCRG
jgi:hypothetical protein